MAKNSDEKPTPAKRAPTGSSESPAASLEGPAGAVAQGRPEYSPRKRNSPASDDPNLDVAASTEHKRRKIVSAQSSTPGPYPEHSKILGPEPENAEISGSDPEHAKISGFKPELSEASGPDAANLEAPRSDPGHSVDPGPNLGHSKDPGLDPTNSMPEKSKVSGTGPNIVELSDNVLQIIFSYLLEQDLCRVAQTCWRLNELADDEVLWKRLYKQVYEYDLPLAVGTDPREIYFVQIDAQTPSSSRKSTKSKAKSSKKSTNAFPGLQMEPWSAEKPIIQKASSTSDETQSTALPGPSRTSSSMSRDVHRVRNPWRESFRHLYHAVHVYSRYDDYDYYGTEPKQSGRSIRKSSCIFSAYKMCQAERKKPGAKDHSLILVHPGKYWGEMTFIESNDVVLGCGPGPNPAQAVVIELDTEESYIVLEEHAYLGYVTVRFNYGRHNHIGLHPGTERRQYAIPVEGPSAPIIDHCILQSSAPDGGGVQVYRAAPTVRFCDISKCKNVGIYIDKDAQGLYEDNVISKCKTAGIQVVKGAEPIIRRNKIVRCDVMGPLVFDEDLGYHRMRETPPPQENS